MTKIKVLQKYIDLINRGEFYGETGYFETYAKDLNKICGLNIDGKTLANIIKDFLECRITELEDD